MKVLLTGYTTKSFNGFVNQESRGIMDLTTIMPMVLRDIGIKPDYVHHAKTDINKYDAVFVKIWNLYDHHYSSHADRLTHYLQRIKNMSKVILISDHHDPRPAIDSFMSNSKFLRELISAPTVKVMNNRYYPGDNMYTIDPSAYCNMNTVTKFKGTPSWVFGSLSGDPPVNVEFEYPLLKVGIERFTTIKETALLDQVARHGLVIANEYPHADPLWWRIRYLMAANTGAAVWSSRRDSTAIYGNYWDPLEIIEDRVRIAQQQAECLLDGLESKTKIRKKVKNILENIG